MSDVTKLHTSNVSLKTRCAPNSSRCTGIHKSKRKNNCSSHSQKVGEGLLNIACVRMRQCFIVRMGHLVTHLLSTVRNSVTSSRRGVTPVQNTLKMMGVGEGRRGGRGKRDAPIYEKVVRKTRLAERPIHKLNSKKKLLSCAVKLLTLFP